MRTGEPIGLGSRDLGGGFGYIGRRKEIEGKLFGKYDLGFNGERLRRREFRFQSSLFDLRAPLAA